MAKTGGVVEAFPSGAPKITRTAAAAITAGRLVEVAGVGTVQHAAAASLKVIGVALEGTDFVGTPDKLAVATGGVFFLTATGAVTAGDQLIAAANGTVSTLPAAAGAVAADINNARAVIGKALDSIAGGQSGRVLLNVAG
jgi:hypothetical protein